MGFNISGIVINKNWENNFQELQQVFDWELQREGEINFETASANWKDDGLCDVYFTEKGTLLFLPMDMCIEPWIIPATNCLTFALSETSMAFNLNYTEGAVIKRSLMEVNDERMTDEGNALPIEANSEDASEIIWNQMEVILGKSFGDIDLNEKAIRYTFALQKQPVLEVPVLVSNENIPQGNTIKKWWQFW